MANPIPDDESVSDKRQGAAKSWRDRFPGWEAYEGKSNRPRFVFNSDTEPNKEIRRDANLIPNTAAPQRRGLLVVTLGIAVGILLLLLLSFLVYRRFQQPSPRNPQNTQTGRLIAPALVRMEDGIADHVFPLRKQHHVHQLSEAQTTGTPSTVKSPAQPKLRRAMDQ
jgi:hypothetical protein